MVMATQGEGEPKARRQVHTEMPARASRQRSVVLAVLAAMGLVATAQAAEWSRSASLSVGAVYTDNKQLTPHDEKSDFFGVARPSISVAGRGARASLLVNGALEFNTMGGDSDHVNPYLNANANAELLEEFLFTDVYARAYQTTVNPFRPSSNTALDRTGNSETTYMWGISPYIQKHFGSFATFRARYRADEQMSDENGFDDSSYQSIDASLVSGSDFGRLDWGLHGQQRRTDYSNNAGTGRGHDSDYSSADLRLGYRLSRQWRLTASVGHEWREYDAALRDRDENTWSAGFVWTPNPRTSLSVSQGYRNFGNNPRVDFRWRKRHLDFHASYEHTLTDTRSIRALPGNIVGSDPSLPQYDPVTGELLPIFRDRTFLNAGMVADDRYRTGLTINGLRSTLSLNAARSKQEREDTHEEAIFDDLTLNLTRRLSRTLSINAGVMWSRDEDHDEQQADTRRWFMGLNRQLGVRTSVSVNYTHSKRDSDRLLDDYTENRVYVNFLFTL